MEIKDRLKVTIRGDKEITAWHLEVAFELEGEEYASNDDYNTGEVGEAITASLEESFKEWVSE